MKREKERFAKRPYAVEYFEQLVHKNYVKRGFCATEENAYVKAGEHLDRGQYVKAVVVKRKAGLVVVTRMKFAGRTTWDQPGDIPRGGKSVDLTLHVPPLEDNE